MPTSSKAERAADWYFAKDWRRVLILTSTSTSVYIIIGWASGKPATGLVWFVLSVAAGYAGGIAIGRWVAKRIRRWMED